jgi:hypothetical protein
MIMNIDFKDVAPWFSLVGGVGAILAGGWAALQAVLLQQWKQAQALEVERLKGSFAQDVERLRASFAQDLERLKLQQSIAGFVHQTKFSSLHERRVDVLAGLYSRIVRAERAITVALSPVPKLREAQGVAGYAEKVDDEVVAASNDLIDYFSSNRIWIPRHVCVSVDQLINVQGASWWERQYGRKTDDSDSEAWGRFLREATILRGDVESETRRILEVIETPSMETRTVD